MKRISRRYVWCLLLMSSWQTGCTRSDPGYFQGYVEGEYVYVASSVSGDLHELPVSKGRTVSEGDALFRLDPNPQALQLTETTRRVEQARARLEDLSIGSRPSELAVIQARLDAARTSLDLAGRDYRRRVEIRQTGGADAISEEELDRFQSDVSLKQQAVTQAEAELETARLGGRTGAVEAAMKEVDALEASLGQIRWQLDQKTVTAPKSGFIQDTLYREGEFVPAGRPVISMLPPGNIRIRFFVPEARFPSIELDDSVQVRLDGMDTPIDARISHVSSEAEFTPPVIYSRESRSKLVFMIEAIPDGEARNRLHPGQPLEVRLK